MESVKISNAEAEVMYDAIWEYETSGRTNIKCPRCGNDLDITVRGNSALALCKTEGCLCVKRRGL